ncbi:hypothetical protein FRZ61_32980 [Hypericibacter adhaerens]|uniref:Uncharacterized protein n=1 Tax=Hypericibacter adhaerens TaxID=2602016 RepID=A0A5J6N495_9PROT|nr:hypothetical protein [Hypericibacter adhaerens]QEX23360.1 hypothetical protein FRZ61_32980 [Hypericibacter adhaerens]
MRSPLAIPTEANLWEHLRSTAMWRLRSILERHGNRLSSQHHNALWALIVSMVARLEGTDHGRLAFGLPTGMGKTTAIVALCAALEGVRHLTGSSLSSTGTKTIAVSASKVEALCELKRAMIAEGVNPEHVGLIHSKRYWPSVAEKIKAGEARDDYASEPSEGHDRPILLVSHARVRGQNGAIADYMQRDLLIWDESLFVSDSSGVSLCALDESAGALERVARYKPEFVDLADYLDSCIGLCLAKREELKESGKPEVVFRFPSLSADYMETFRGLLGTRHETVSRLLDYVNEPIRYIPTSLGGVLSYRLAIPDELENIVILDASHPIRELVRSTQGVIDAEREHPLIASLGINLSGIKRFDQTTIKFMKRSGGRTGMTRNLLKTGVGQERSVSRELIEVIRNIPKDEAVLVFTYKPRPKDKRSMASVLLADLEDAGIDINAKVTDHSGQERDRITVLTWGQETSSNHYSHCKHVILAGVLMRAEEDVAAAFVGETRNIGVDIDNALIRSLIQSEAAHCAYQAASRGSCRTAVNGMAEAMTLWLMHADPVIVQTLQEVMPGVKVEPWLSVTTSFKGAKGNAAAVTIAGFLGGLPQDTDMVSIRFLKRKTGLDGMPAQSFKRARDAALQSVPWAMNGRSLVRVFPGD